jgi:hypothetical protein
LLVRATSEHTSSGHHARVLETWQAWGKGQGITRTDLPKAADAMQALSSPVLEWTGGARPPGLLPWY